MAIKVTKLEKALLEDICRESELNGDTVDLTKSFQEQDWESEAMFCSYSEVNIRAKRLGMTASAVKGVLSSLVKKKLVICHQDGQCDWLLIEEGEFNNIKQALGYGG